MITARRLLLVVLLTLLVIGFTGHVFAIVSAMHHVQSESTCAFHQGINLPARLQTARSILSISPEPVHDNACALELSLKISHPPSA